MGLPCGIVRYKILPSFHQGIYLDHHFLIMERQILDSSKIVLCMYVFYIRSFIEFYLSVALGIVTNHSPFKKWPEIEILL